MEDSTDPTFGFIDKFEVTTGEIVLDREESANHYGYPTRLVRDVRGKEGYVWSRRLQPVPAPPFGLRQDMEAVPNWDCGPIDKATKPILKQILAGLGVPVKEGSTQKGRQLYRLNSEKVQAIQNEERPENRKYLRVYRPTYNLTAANTISQADAEEGEFLILNQDEPAKASSRPYRDFEGFETQLEDEDVELVAERGWNLTFRKPPAVDDTHKDGDVFEPHRTTPDSTDDDITHGDTTDEVEGENDANGEEGLPNSSTPGNKRPHSAAFEDTETPKRHKIQYQTANGHVTFTTPTKQNADLATTEDAEEVMDTTDYDSDDLWDAVQEAEEREKDKEEGKNEEDEEEDSDDEGDVDDEDDE